MPKNQLAQKPPSNCLLDLLGPDHYERLSHRLRKMPLEFKQVLYPVRGAISHVYFPLVGVASALTVMADGRAIEVATIGREGMVGLHAFLGAGISPNQLIVQVAGEALRMPAAALRDEMNGAGPFRDILVRYNTAYSMQVSQGTACNGLHSVAERCCRWLLETHDRVAENEFALTHEFLGIMLGVRRASVSEVLEPLHDAGLVKNHRGKVRVLDRKGVEAKSCECYRTIADEFRRLFAEG